VDSQPHINQIEEQPKPGVRESEKHRRSTSYRSGDPTPSSLPADEYVTPTGSRGKAKKPLKRKTRGWCIQPLVMQFEL